MKVFCAWCNRFLRETGSKQNKKISHGICKKCLEETTKEFKYEKQAQAQ